MGEAAVAGFYATSEDRPTASGTKQRRRRTSRSGGKGLVEGPGGQDISRMLANEDAVEHPMTAEERQASYARGHALLEAWRKQNELDVALRHVAERAEIDYDPDYREKSLQATERATNAAMRKIHDKRSSSS